MKRREYCKCNEAFTVVTDDDEWGEWDVCTNCGKEIEGTYKEFNHYDGEDHMDD